MNTHLITIITIAGAKYLIFLIVVLAGVSWLKLPRDKKWEMAKAAMIAFPLAFVLARIASLLYYDPRPFVHFQFVPLIPHAADNGFPSDHALLSSALAAWVYLFNRKHSYVLWVLAILVGIARVVAGVHSPIDILGSALIAIGATWVASVALRRFSARSKA